MALWENLNHRLEMLHLTKQEKISILERIRKELTACVEKFNSQKFPEKEYQRLLNAFGSPQKVTTTDIQDALVWKYGHWGKKNYPGNHRRLIESVQAKWPYFLEQPPGDPELFFNFWMNQLCSRTRRPFITICFLLHLLERETIPIMDQHTFRAMNFLIKKVRPNWRSQVKPTQYRDLLMYRDFFHSLYRFWLVQGDAPCQRTFDKFLMMFGKHTTERPVAGEQKWAGTVPQQVTKEKEIPTFQEVYGCLLHFGPATVVSNRNIEYTVKAGQVKGIMTIIAYPRSGRVTIHEDCWGCPLTCQGTRAGGIYNGSYSIYDWYAEHREE